MISPLAELLMLIVLMAVVAIADYELDCRQAAERWYEEEYGNT